LDGALVEAIGTEAGKSMEERDKEQMIDE